MSNRKATNNGGTAGVRPADRPGDIRNVVLVGRPDSGKTTLAEALLVSAGTVPRGTPANGPDDQGQRHSVTLGIYPLRYDDLVVNLLDTPGLPDFVGELRAGLRAADAALFVVAATAEIDPATVALWAECDVQQTPRAVVITRLDAHNASYDTAVARCQEAFPGAVPLYLLDSTATVVTGLLTRTVSDYSESAPGTASSSERPAGAKRRDWDPARDVDIETARDTLIEAIIDESEDESLLERYVGGEQIDVDVLLRDLEKAVCHGTFFPIMPACSGTGVGLGELLEILPRGFPPPTEVSLPPVRTPEGEPVELDCTADGPLLGEVVRTSIDPYLGRLTVLRLFSGTLSKDLPIHVCGRGGEARGHFDHDSDEPVGQLYSPFGSALRPIDKAVAGDLCVLTRLTNAETADTVSARSKPLVVEPWPLPEPLLPVAIEAPTRSDEDALPKALARLTASDPTVRVERNAETGQLVLWCLGEAHAEVALQTLRAHGATVTSVPVRVALRRTFAAAAQGHGRLVKQSGGHGQYAVCDVTVTPLPRGSGVTFETRVVGGTVPTQFVGSVEKGARHQLEHGLDADGLPVTDVHVALCDGKAHSVDSSDAAFQAAGALAVRHAAAQVETVLLEPLADIAVTVPDAHVGAVLSDLASRRGRVTGTEPTAVETAGRSVVRAEVPEAELATYVVTLRAMSGGTGSFTRKFSRYDVVPASAVNRMAANV